MLIALCLALVVGGAIGAWLSFWWTLIVSAVLLVLWAVYSAGKSAVEVEDDPEDIIGTDA